MCRIKNDLSPALMTMSGGNRQPLIMEGDMNKFVKLIDDTNCGFNPIPKQHYDVAPTLRASRYELKKMEENDLGEIRIRKLTPTECYKLMGFTAEDCKKASDAGISNTQLYKQAGNSIVVNVLEAIFTELGKNYDEFRPGLRNFERE